MTQLLLFTSGLIAGLALFAAAFWSILSAWKRASFFLLLAAISASAASAAAATEPALLITALVALNIGFIAGAAWRGLFDEAKREGYEHD